MKKGEIEIGKTYAARVSGKIAPVTIIHDYPGYKRNQWLGRNEHTGREVFIRSAARLRFPMYQVERDAPCGVCGGNDNPHHAYGVGLVPGPCRNCKGTGVSPTKKRVWVSVPE